MADGCILNSRLCCYTNLEWQAVKALVSKLYSYMVPIVPWMPAYHHTKAIANMKQRENRGIRGKTKRRHARQTVQMNSVIKVTREKVYVKSKRTGKTETVFGNTLTVTYSGSIPNVNPKRDRNYGYVRNHVRCLASIPEEETMVKNMDLFRPLYYCERSIHNYNDYKKAVRYGIERRKRKRKQP